MQSTSAGAREVPPALISMKHCDSGPSWRWLPISATCPLIKVSTTLKICKFYQLFKIQKVTKYRFQKFKKETSKKAEDFLIHDYTLFAKMFPRKGRNIVFLKATYLTAQLDQLIFFWSADFILSFVGLLAFF